MIPYSNSSFGLWLLTRVHGSALYKSLLPAVISTIMYFVMAHTARKFGTEEDLFEVFVHPYPMNALVTAFTFLLVFRANYRSVSQLNRDRRDLHDKANTDSKYFESSFFHFCRIFIHIATIVGGKLTQQCI